jgi:hypothetical protein
VVGRKVGEAVQASSGNGNFRLTQLKERFVVADPATGDEWVITIEERVSDARQRFAQDSPSPEEELTMALAIREMNNRGVAWTDHKPTNFDIMPNRHAPTGYQMVIFDTGGMRPVTGATAEKRAATAGEIQSVFDRSAALGGPGGIEFRINVDESVKFFDNRVFGADPGVTSTPNLLFRPDRYLDFAALSQDELLAYARGLLGKDVAFSIGPRPPNVPPDVPAAPP